MQPTDGGPVERLELDQRPDVLHAWVAQLRQRFHGAPDRDCARTAQGRGATPAPFPQPFNVEPAIMGLAHAISQADNDLKATGRFRDASLAEAGPEQSGKAIIARQRQDELSNGGFINGHLVGLASVCRQLIELYRVLYTTAQIVRITGDDDQKRKVMIFNGAENDPRQQDGFQPDQSCRGAASRDLVLAPGRRRRRSSSPPGSKRLASISEKMRSTSAFGFVLRLLVFGRCHDLRPLDDELGLRDALLALEVGLLPALLGLRLGLLELRLGLGLDLLRLDGLLGLLVLLL